MFMSAVYNCLQCTLLSSLLQICVVQENFTYDEQRNSMELDRLMIMN